MKRNRRLSLYLIALALFFCEPIESFGAGSQYVDEMVSQAVEQELLGQYLGAGLLDNLDNFLGFSLGKDLM